MLHKQPLNAHQINRMAFSNRVIDVSKIKVLTTFVEKRAHQSFLVQHEDECRKQNQKTQKKAENPEIQKKEIDSFNVN